LYFSQRQFAQALGYTISGEQCGLKETFLFQAQLEWEGGSKELALIYLHRGINKYFPDWADYRNLKGSDRIDDRKVCAKVSKLKKKCS